MSDPSRGGRASGRSTRAGVAPDLPPTVRQRGAGGSPRSWITRGVEALAHALQTRPPGGGPDFDLVIVGSGYGGAIAAEHFARRVRRDDGAPLRIALLERGEERLAGSFPASFAELPGDLRIAQAGADRVRGNPEGLFDLRVGPDMCALVANGLGGGSLINAGVMLAPRDPVFAGRGWPAEIRALDAAALRRAFERTRRVLGVGDGTSVEGGPAGGLPGAADPDAPACRVGAKYWALARLAPGATRPVPVTIATRGGDRADAATLDACVHCGDCATGCNHNAKDSLDLNLLVRAHDAGVELYTGATVTRLERADAGHWLLRVAFTHAGRARRNPPLAVTARRVIVAAGTLGSTELLMRSRGPGLAFSERLGARFSGNGDMIAAVVGQDRVANAAADERVAPARRRVGPTITGMIDLRDDPAEPVPIVIQELGIPGPLRRLLDEALANGSFLHDLDQPDTDDHSPDTPRRDPRAIDPREVLNTTLVAMMGDDGAAGRVAIAPGGVAADPGTAAVHWEDAGSQPLFEAQLDALRRRVAAQHVGERARVLPNPMWRPLSDQVEAMLGRVRGPLLTVHPLGGCAMADTPADGVVDALGRVFDPRASAGVHDGLAVLDGSIVPGALGVNPALTIAMLALHACDRLWTDDWPLPQASAAVPPAVPGRRPVYRRIDPQQAPPQREPTEMEVVERQTGVVSLWIDHVPTRCIVELTLRFEPVRVRALAARHGAVMRLADDSRNIPARPGEPVQHHPKGRPRSELRIFREADRLARALDPTIDDIDDEIARGRDTLYLAPLTGTLRMLVREASGRRGRSRRAMSAWALNRGLRDIRLGIGQLFSGRSGGWSTWWRRLRAGGSRAGEVRRFEYDLEIGPAVFDREGLERQLADHRSIRTVKRLRYERRANPFVQLQAMTIERFVLPFDREPPPVLQLDSAFLAREAVPLVRLTRMQSLPDAIGDLAALGLGIARTVVGVHLWTFRKPEPPADRIVDRLPQPLPRAGGGHWVPEVTTLAVESGTRGADEPPAGGAVPVLPVVRLSRYRDRAVVRDAPPVVLLHGYSASGTTFAHPALQPSLAGFLLERGYDVWVADLRTSAGLPTATLPWRFEDVAFHDIPAVFAHVRGATGGVPIHVVAHCMGTVMLAMAVLRPRAHTGPWRRELAGLPGWLGHVLLSQAGPVLSFSPANVLRAYVMRYARQLLGGGAWLLRAGTPPSAADDLLDRLLAALPYRDDQHFDEENPSLWVGAAATSFVRTRHRMDALYGETFRLERLPRAVRDAIDDLFGPLNLETVAQVIKFAQLQQLAAAEGAPDAYGGFRVDPATLAERWTFPTLQLQSLRNGLIDPATVQRTRYAFRHLADRYRVEALAGMGHQDPLIGHDAQRVFERIERFLGRGHDPRGDDR